MALLTYSPSNVLVSVAGLHTVQGYADGTFVRIYKESKPFEMKRAMDGSVERLFNKDEGYKVELTLAQTSTTNNVLSAIHNVDIVTKAGKFPLVVKDTTGQTSFFAGTAWIENIPEVIFSGGMETRTWVFGCTQAGLLIGGNGDISTIEDALLVGSSFLPVLAEFGIFGN